MIIINGQLWRVCIVSPQHPALITPAGRSAIGCCDSAQRTIFISKRLSLKSIKKVLMHEITHAIIYSYNISMNENTEEIVADLMATHGAKMVDLSHTAYNEILQQK